MTQAVIFIVFFGSGLLLAHPAPCLSASDYEDGLRGLAQTLRAETETHRLRRVAVADFTNLDGDRTSLGRFLAEELSTELVGAASVHIIDRAHLNQLLRKHKIDDVAVIDPAGMKKLADAAEIDAVVVGMVIELPHSIRVTIKLIAAKTRHIVATAKAVFSKTGEILQLSEGLHTPSTSTDPRQDSAQSTGRDDTPPEGMVLVQAGPFEYGENNHTGTVVLPAFWIDRYEVTNAQYNTVRAHTFDREHADHPVANVSWNQARIYCEAIGKRLPTEHEWEKAARGTDGRRYPWGDTYEPQFVNAENQRGRTTAVGLFSEGISPYGLSDMAGNVSEWTGSDDEHAKVYKGGSWASGPQNVRSAHRSSIGPQYTLIDLGFRCAKDVPAGVR